MIHSISDDMERPTARLVVGCRLSQDRIYIPVKNRTCGHDTPLDGKFCKECGLPVYTEENKPIFDKDSLRPSPEMFASISRGRLHVVFGTPRRGYSPEFVVIGHIVGIVDNPSTITIPTNDQIATTKTQVKELLKPIGLWDEKSFGVWLFTLH